MTSIAERVIALAEHLSGRETDPSTRLLEDLELDSLDRIQLAVDIEKQFDIVIPDEDVDNPELGTIAGLIAYVERKVALPVISAVLNHRPGVEL